MWGRERREYIGLSGRMWCGGGQLDLLLKVVQGMHIEGYVAIPYTPTDNVAMPHTCIDYVGHKALG